MHDAMHIVDSRLLSRRLRRRALVSGLAAGAVVATKLAGAPALAQEASPAAGETRLIVHAMGETAVPVAPRRVVVLDGPQLDAALALGVTPVGATLAMAGADFPAYLGDRTAGIELVGLIQEPDLEAIVLLEPDLILGYKFRHEELYPLLSEIAPTVFADVVGVNWRRDFLLFADALNKQAEAEAIAAAYDERVAALAEALGPDLEATTVSVLRFRADDVRIYFPTSFIGTILADIGLPRPASQAEGTPDKRFTAISRELIRDIDGTVMFVSSYGDLAATELAGYVADPLWQTLGAVQTGRVYWVDDETWMVAIGYLAANEVLDDLAAYLIDGAPATPLPVS